MRKIFLIILACALAAAFVDPALAAKTKKARKAPRVSPEAHFQQALTRLAHCVLTANVGLPHRSTREAIALAIHIVAHISRVNGRRQVTELLAITGYDSPHDRFVLKPCLQEASPQVVGGS